MRGAGEGLGEGDRVVSQVGHTTSCSRRLPLVD